MKAFFWNYTAQPHDMMQSFEEIQGLGVGAKTKWDGQEGGGRAFQYLPSPACGAAGYQKDNKATRSPEISREQVQKLTPQFLLYIYIGYRFPLSLIYYLGKPPSS